MYQASEQFNTAILGDNRTFRAKLKSGGTEITSGIISIKQYAQSASETITIGGAMSAYVEIQMWKPDVQLEGNEVEISIGLMVDGELEYVPIGLYTVQKPEDDDGVISFTGYDRMQSKMGGAYFSELAYPSDGKSVLAEISSKTGVPIDTSSLPDGVMINERVSCEESDVDEYGEPVVNVTYVNPFNGYTYRDALGYIAQLYGKFASVNRSGTVVFRWYQEVDYEINQDRYYDDLTVAEHVFSVGAISCKVGEQVLHSGTGTASIQMENPVMTQDLLDSVYQQIKDIQFIPSSLSFYGDTRLDLGDIVTVNDKRGNVIKVPVMQICQDFDGGLLSKVQSFGGTLSDDNNKGPTERKLDQIYTDLFLVKELVGNKANFKLAYDLSVSVSGHTEQLNVQSGRIDSLSDRTTELEFGATGIKTTVSEIRTDLSGTQAKLNTVESQANQAADHISWIVKSGTSATDFTLTDRTAQLITDSLVIKNSTGASTIISGGKMDINQIFAQDITATGTIHSATLEGATGSFSGSVTATSGSFANWTISQEDDGLVGTNGDIKTYVLAGTNNNSDFLVVKNGDTYPFYVKTDGSMHAKELGVSYIRCDGNVNVNGDMNVAGSSYASNWFRSTGTTGWYNETYGGGIWMADDAWVRVYGGKGFLCDSLIQCGNTLYGNGYVELYGYTPFIDFHFNNSTADHTSRIIEARQGVLEFNNTLVVGSNITRPFGDNTVLLGTSQYRWAAVYAANGTIQTSDEREKDIIGCIDDRYLAFFAETVPILYRWRYGDDKRIRVGIGAQSAEAALKASGLSLQQYAGIEHDYFDAPTANGLTDRYSMDYTMYCLLAAEQTKRNAKAINVLKTQYLSHDAQIESLQQQLIDARQQIAEQASEIAQLRSMIGAT